VTDVHQVVPRGLLITGTSAANRIHVEQQKLAERFPSVKLYRADDGEISARGVLRTNVGEVYGFQILLPRDYPHSIPTIFPIGWDASSCPHSYVAGNLCIMRPEQWRPFYSLALVVAKTALWLNKFDVFRVRGYWPGNEQQH
jgi:ubiquitin-protein ligase